VLVNSDKYPEETQVLIDHPDGAYSSADVDRVDYEKFSGIEKFEYYTATLNKGDCLYIPLKWQVIKKIFKIYLKNLNS